MHGRIVVHNLTFSYGNNTVLENVNLDIAANQVITIIGPNGGGKTTLLRLIAGLLSPDAGSVLINGKSPKYNRGRIGYVPQHSHFDRKYPITVFEVVLSGLLAPFGFYSALNKLKAETMIASMGLESLKHRPFQNLSGGQSQRMLIARALVSDAAVLLLDEPTSSIDSTSEKDLTAVLKEISRKMTIIVATHDTGFVSAVTDRVFCINRRLVEHPLDADFSDIIASSYGGLKKIVRHETVIGPETRKD
jgi:zinc transport system ATP-binding protein